MNGLKRGIWDEWRSIKKTRCNKLKEESSVDGQGTTESGTPGKAEPKHWQRTVCVGGYWWTPYAGDKG